jgi:hypothetical protein
LPDSEGGAAAAMARRRSTVAVRRARSSKGGRGGKSYASLPKGRGDGGYGVCLVAGAGGKL